MNTLAMVLLLRMCFLVPLNDMKIFYLLALLFVAAGCSDSNTATTETTGGGVGSSGDFMGNLRLYDYRGRPMADRSGAKVQIEGTSFSAITDKNGDWIIHNLPTRTYAISFSKENFSTRRNPSYTFVGGEPVRYRDPDTYNDVPGNPIESADIYELPRFTIQVDAVTMPTVRTVDTLGQTLTLYTYGALFAHTSDNTPDSATIGMYVIAGRDSNLRIEDTSTYFLKRYVITSGSYSTDRSVDLAVSFNYSDITGGVQPGKRVYFKAYPVNGYQFQFNQITNTLEYFGNGPTASNVLSAIL
jgi:hypothetical protein